MAIASVRLATPSLAKVFSRCLRTVPGEPELAGDRPVMVARGDQLQEFLLPCRQGPGGGAAGLKRLSP